MKKKICFYIYLLTMESKCIIWHIASIITMAIVALLVAIIYTCLIPYFFIKAIFVPFIHMKDFYGKKGKCEVRKNFDCSESVTIHRRI